MIATTAGASEPERDALFRIERNKNANIVQYDAQVEADGTLNRKDPVVAYWVRLADQGQLRELTWVQKKFAYGFKAKLNNDRSTATLDMAANLGRLLTVKQTGNDYQAVADIEGAACYVEKIYIDASGKGTSTKVNFIEIYGSAVDGGIEHYERLVP